MKSVNSFLSILFVVVTMVASLADASHMSSSSDDDRDSCPWVGTFNILNTKRFLNGEKQSVDSLDQIHWLIADTVQTNSDYIPVRVAKESIAASISTGKSYFTGIGHSKTILASSGVFVYEDNQGEEIGELHWVKLLDYAKTEVNDGEWSITGGTGIFKCAEGWFDLSVKPDGTIVSKLFLCDYVCYNYGKGRDKGKGKGKSKVNGGSYLRSS
jgi:hypothetical protein